jgi:MAF protein
MPRIVLASTSPYRKGLLERLRMPFSVQAPETDETPRAHEPPKALVARLATEKAHSVGRREDDALVIGSDQVAVLDGEILGKPGDAETNRYQLEQASGRPVEFLTGLCLLNAASGRTQVDVVPFTVVFRVLTREQIAAYVEAERAYDCAGGFRCEGLAAALFERLEGADPSALIGLPLVRLVQMLAEEGVDVLLEARAAET